MNTNKSNIPTKYVDQIDLAHPGHIHFLYRYATNGKGYKTEFAALALAMNNKSATPLESRSSLYFCLCCTP